MVATLCTSARLSRCGKYPLSLLHGAESLCCIVMPTCIVLPFCLNHLLMCIVMLIAAIEFTLRRSREIVLRTVRTCLQRNQSDQQYMVKHLSRPAIAGPSVDSELFYTT